MLLSKIKIVACLLLIAPLAHAELADREQPLQIEADQVWLDQAKQISTFTGHVKFDQGTLQLRGTKVVVSQDAQGYKLGQVTGDTASFRQKREGLNEYVEGYAQRIEYDTHTQILDLYGQARLKREGDFIHGEHINYNSQTEIFVVNDGGQVGNVPTKRVRAVLQPRSQVPAVNPVPATSLQVVK
ncbi:MAG: lipopolysaccharide transport periplasmic protein LptA [Gallionella sp.]